ncbi:hypothetical protein BK138_13950 [Paenibacillus rhizosphaerae]|uniref:Uncharacterized protein n=1 Tax=Paenibacillus rhizosphaerae TaxID=297318 RepID=A0A1R1ER19_9BACL|nr:hypothetical protein [Paenibacillus rhizosphaerae]OMF54293.1 hypothetical protein BK138_13950 [Paenibacillus rhizosphaerae]
MLRKTILITAVMLSLSNLAGKSTYADHHPSGVGIYSGPKLSAVEEQKENERIGLIVTTFGDFARVDQAIGFNESEIARKMSDIGPNTEEIITDHGVYVKIPEFMWYP